MLTFAQKKEAVAELHGKFERAKSVIVADYRGLGVEALNALRAKLRAEGRGDYEYRVVKNSVLRRAVQGSAVEPLQEHVQGPTAVAISFGDPVGLARTLVNYAKEHPAFEVKGGVLDGRAIDSREIATLASLPSLEELRARLVGLLQAPAQKIAVVLQAPGAQLARLASARQKQLKEGAS